LSTLGSLIYPVAIRPAATAATDIAETPEITASVFTAAIPALLVMIQVVREQWSGHDNHAGELGAPGLVKSTSGTFQSSHTDFSTAIRMMVS